MSEIRVGLLGASRIAIDAVLTPAKTVTGVRVVAVAARDPARAAAYANAHQIERAMGSYAELLESPDIDLVYVGTPPSTHAELAMDAIRAGKAVLVEKPFAMDPDEAQAVFALAQERAVPVFEGMHSPHHRLFGRLIQVLERGDIGHIHDMEAEFSVPIPENDKLRWSTSLGGGALMDLGVYPLAWARRIAGESFQVEKAKARFYRGVDALFEAELRFADGVTATVRSSMVVDRPRASIVVRGSKGTLKVVNPLAPQLGHALEILVDSKATVESVQGPTTYESQLTAIHATLTRGEKFAFSSDDYVNSMRAIEKVQRALQASLHASGSSHF